MKIQESFKSTVDIAKSGKHKTYFLIFSEENLEVIKTKEVK